VAQRTNALPNPIALFRKPLSLQEYLDARPIAEPLHLFDCVMPCAGGEGFLVMSEDRARDAGPAYAQLLGTIERHNAFARGSDPDARRLGDGPDDLYEQAGVGPRDMDFVQTYDDYPVITAMQFEDLGILRQGRRSAVHPRAHLHL
jgi:acetyl-CoA acetyltransferase